MQIELGKIEKGEFYADKAFRRGKTRLGLTKIKKRSMGKEEKYKHLEMVRLSVIKDSICNDMNRILAAFPQYKELDFFYKELFGCFIDVDKYKKSLGAVKWARKKINSIYSISDKDLRRKKTIKEMTSARNVFIARSASVLKQINDAFSALEEARRKIKDMPNIKTSLFTVAVAGFPNVGKSTLLGKLTDSKPEVKSYAFTTKGLMIGFIKSDNGKIQIIDTPGKLNRLNKMNKIEKMAHLCMRDVAQAIVYVFDLTETSYELSEQIKLYNDIKKMDKEIIVYFSKSDILDTKKIDGFEIDGIYDVKELKKIIMQFALEQA